MFCSSDASKEWVWVVGDVGFETMRAKTVDR